MKTNFDKETGTKTWELTKWYDKTVYVVGYILIVIYAIGFILGMVVGVMGSV